MFSFVDFAFAFDHLIENLDVYSIDVPKLVEILPLFIAWAVYDGVINPSYILKGESFSKDET